MLQYLRRKNPRAPTKPRVDDKSTASHGSNEPNNQVLITLIPG